MISEVCDSHPQKHKAHWLHGDPIHSKKLIQFHKSWVRTQKSWWQYQNVFVSIQIVWTPPMKQHIWFQTYIEKLDKIVVPQLEDMANVLQPQFLQVLNPPLLPLHPEHSKVFDVSWNHLSETAERTFSLCSSSWASSIRTNPSQDSGKFEYLQTPEQVVHRISPSCSSQSSTCTLAVPVRCQTSAHHQRTQSQWGSQSQHHCHQPWS